eukprot:1176652-Prorocentrum_minimum.AAC.2
MAVAAPPGAGGAAPPGAGAGGLVALVALLAHTPSAGCAELLRALHMKDAARAVPLMADCGITRRVVRALPHGKPTEK